MIAVSVTTHPMFTTSTPQMLWRGRYALGTSSACGPLGPTSSNSDVTADGHRFLMIKDNETESFPSQINVVLSWSEELKRLTSEGRKAP
jgi:hypothetical protein